MTNCQHDGVLSKDGFCLKCGHPATADARFITIARLTTERDAARANAQTFMEQRDAAHSLLERFVNQHRDMALHDEEACDLCAEAERLTRIR